MVKNLPAVWETWVWSLGREDPLEEGMASHCSILAWRIPWTEEPGGLQSTGSQRVGHSWEINYQHWVTAMCQQLCLFIHITLTTSNDIALRGNRISLQLIWVLLALPFTSCVTLGKVRHLSVPQFSLSLSLSFFFLTAPHSLLDLGSLTRPEVVKLSQDPGSKSTES